ncbi:TorD/DmsD family molecular chaperone [Pseudodesulfovibrio sp.]|uniref:TorD/DmsD family molecular chaperone n=1 Tax=unclassified Pseudodesulfovibrio TaxID=2661612 RepID=UPI003AFFA92B
MDRKRICEGLTALRDFFASIDAKDLKAASVSISHHFDIPLDAATDWTGVEYDFNRLFVGPAAVPAPPYASAYAKEPILMGRSTMEVRDAYRSLGLMVPDQGSTPDDHLAYELDAVAAMVGAGEDVPGLEEVREWFIGEHMADWIPRFVDAVRQQPEVSAPVRMAVGALSGWLESARTVADA